MPRERDYATIDAAYYDTKAAVQAREYEIYAGLSAEEIARRTEASVKYIQSLPEHEWLSFLHKAGFAPLSQRAVQAYDDVHIPQFLYESFKYAHRLSPEAQERLLDLLGVTSPVLRATYKGSWKILGTTENLIRLILEAPYKGLEEGFRQAYEARVKQLAQGNLVIRDARTGEVVAVVSPTRQDIRQVPEIKPVAAPTPVDVGAGFVGVRAAKAPHHGTMSLTDLLDAPFLFLTESAIRVADWTYRYAAKAPLPLAIPAAVGGMATTFTLGFLSVPAGLVSPRAWRETFELAKGLVFSPRETLTGMFEYYAWENPLRMFALAGMLAFPLKVKVPTPLQRVHALIPEEIAVRGVRGVTAGEAAVIGRITYPEVFALRTLKRLHPEEFTALREAAFKAHEMVWRAPDVTPERLLTRRRVLFAETFAETFARESLMKPDIMFAPEVARLLPRADIRTLFIEKPYALRGLEGIVEFTGRLEGKGWRFGFRTAESLAGVIGDKFVLYVSEGGRKLAMLYEPSMLKLGLLEVEGGRFRIRNIIMTGERAAFPYDVSTLAKRIREGKPLFELETLKVEAAVKPAREIVKPRMIDKLLDKTFKEMVEREAKVKTVQTVKAEQVLSKLAGKLEVTTRVKTPAPPISVFATPKGEVQPQAEEVKISKQAFTDIGRDMAAPRAKPKFTVTEVVGSAFEKPLDLASYYGKVITRMLGDTTVIREKPKMEPLARMEESVKTRPPGLEPGELLREVARERTRVEPLSRFAEVYDDVIIRKTKLPLDLGFGLGPGVSEKQFTKAFGDLTYGFALTKAMFRPGVSEIEKPSVLERETLFNVSTRKARATTLTEYDLMADLKQASRAMQAFADADIQLTRSYRLELFEPKVAARGGLTLRQARRQSTVMDTVLGVFETGRAGEWLGVDVRRADLATPAARTAIAPAIRVPSGATQVRVKAGATSPIPLHLFEKEWRQLAGLEKGGKGKRAWIEGWLPEVAKGVEELLRR